MPKVLVNRMRRLSREERAYLAGIIDGEGTVGIYRNRGAYMAPMVRVTNTNKALLDWLRKLGGGFVSKETKSGFGGRLACFAWSVQSRKDVANLLRQVLPFLIVKRQNAESVLRALEVRA